jgi:hypothetical protein
VASALAILANVATRIRLDGFILIGERMEETIDVRSGGLI